MQSAPAPVSARSAHPSARTHAARRIGSALLACAALLGANDAVLAQGQLRSQRLAAAQQETLRAKLNETTVILATSHPTASYFAMAHDITAALGRSDDVRVLPLASSGGLENLRDLLFLRGVDMAIVPANALVQAKATESLGPGLPQRIAYITRLYSEEVHILVGRNVQALGDLRGMRVAIPQDDGTAQFTAADLFARIGVEIKPVSMPASEAIEQVRSGELPAVLLVGGKPLPFLSGLPKDGSVRLLGLPYAPALEEGYTAAALRSDDYPELIPPGSVIETVAVSAVLLAHTSRGTEESWQRVAKFVPAFFGAMSDRPLLGRHAKWREVNLAAMLPGWPRLPAAEEWLRRAQQQQAASLQKSFEEFLRETRPPGSPNLTAPQRKKLFDEFVSWTRNSVSDAEAEPRR